MQQSPPHWPAGSQDLHLKDTVTDYKSETNKSGKHLWLPPMATDSLSLNGNAGRKICHYHSFLFCVFLSQTLEQNYKTIPLNSSYYLKQNNKKKLSFSEL